MPIIYGNNQNKNMTFNEPMQNRTEQQKEELILLTIEDAITKANIVGKENLNKIKFFISQGLFDVNAIKMDISTGMFYNQETNEVYEIRKKQGTDQYEINKVSGLSLDNPKTRTLKLNTQKPYNMNNAAFTKVTFLITNIITFIILTAMIILLNKLK